MSSTTEFDKKYYPEPRTLLTIQLKVLKPNIATSKIIIIDKIENNVEKGKKSAKGEIKLPTFVKAVLSADGNSITSGKR